ncbi:hypothetical protein E3N88_41567 [Mikania micrantha]|uniref:Reverse transcriptase Ty1/copia-type domain-containing protein n=1 Tax=Mikania micrantha TaxID=192012 RepID=A0A5N6LL50_9ASTR|nr:hypothetical protein E3N88_41567 [Mikania micrantha]
MKKMETRGFGKANTSWLRLGLIVMSVTPGVGGICCTLRADPVGRGAQIPPARIAFRGLPGSGVPPGLDFKPNKLVFVVLAQSCPFLDCRTSFERRLDSIGQLLAIIDFSAIKLSQNPVMHRRTKHIDIKFHYLRELVEKEKLKMVFCSTKEQVADVMTKPVTLETFEKMKACMGMKKFED